MSRIVKWAAAVAAVLLGAWLIASVVQIAASQQASREDRARLAAEVDQLEDQADANAAALEVANDRLRRAGKQPVEEPEDGEPLPEVIEGEPGARGPRGQSCIEEIGRAACRGDQGAAGSAGSDGRAGTDGEDGADGATGEKGEAGDVGPMGPAGPAGPQGERGPAGQDATLPTGTAGCPEGQYVVAVTLTADGLTVACGTPALVPIE